MSIRVGPGYSSGHFHSYFANDFDENSMASTINSGGSIDVKLLKLTHGQARNSVLTWIK